MNTILAVAFFSPGAPARAEVAAHELVHALEDHLALGALHMQHALVAQHPGAVDIDDRAEEVLQPGRVEGTVRAVDEALHVVVVVMVVAMAFVRVRGMVAVLAVRMVVVVLVVLLEEVRVDVQLGVEVEASQVEHVLQRHFAEMHLLLRRARVHVLQAMDQRLGLCPRRRGRSC